MGEVDDSLAAVLPRQEAAETALLNGDAGPRRAFWSEREPVTILGAARDALNRQQVDGAFYWLEKFLGAARVIWRSSLPEPAETSVT